MKEDLNITGHRNTVKLYAVGINTLDGEKLQEAILKAPFLLVAKDESLRNGDKKFPIFVALFCEEIDSPWWGLFRVCNMKDKTAETQAQLFYDTIINDPGYPRERVLYVLSDNTASVSSDVGGCVAILQRKLNGEDTTAKPSKRGLGAATSGVSRAPKKQAWSGKKPAGQKTPASSSVAAAAGAAGKKGKAPTRRTGSSTRRASAKVLARDGKGSDEESSNEESSIKESLVVFLNRLSCG